ncbi:metalloproteinase inhibitor 2-like [Mizuhopecten yessoensis]|nr:metalloproteinase inhibitor 2-like [Mizuhopecten yessoensis]
MKLCIAVLLLCGVHVVFSCSCAPSIGHPQNFFCNSDAVFIGKVKKVTKPDTQFENIVYVVKVKKSFKGNCKGEVTVTSVNSEGTCGITYLEKRKTYLLTANSGGNGTYSIGICSSRVIEKEDITQKIKKSYNINKATSFPGMNEINCDECKIQYCGENGNCGIIAPPSTTCTYFGDLEKVKCYNKLRCIPSASGNSCRWSASNCGGPGSITSG